MADTSPPFAIVNIRVDRTNTMAADREEIAAAAIKTFDGAFDGKKKDGKGGAGGTRQVRK